MGVPAPVAPGFQAIDNLEIITELAPTPKIYITREPHDNVSCVH